MHCKRRANCGSLGATVLAAAVNHLDASTLENWLWEAACVIRGPVDAPKFKDYILPLVFLKRLSDVFEDEIERLAGEFGDKEVAVEVAEQDRRSINSFYVPDNARWSEIQRQTTRVGEYLTDAVKAVARENPDLQGVVDVQDFNATAAGQPIVDEGRLAKLVQILSRYRLGLNDVEPDVLGRAYEYLLRKFAEGQGQSAGEFYTPREVGMLMARILEPKPGMEVYDPCAGSAGLLIKAHLQLLETHGEQNNGHRYLPRNVSPLKLYGQEINPSTFALAKMNAIIHGMQHPEISLGDTMSRPAFTRDGRIRKFDLVSANPMWNQKFATDTYEHDPYERFDHGVPPASSADWGWVQHMVESLEDDGRLAVVLDTGAVGRGSGNTGSSRERDIRKAFVEGSPTESGDLIEAVVLLPENLFYNMTGPGIILVINRAKRHPGEVLLINASRLFTKGRPKNYLSVEHVETVAGIYQQWREEEGISSIISKEEIAKNDYNLSPSRYVAGTEQEEVLPLNDAIVVLQEAEEEREIADERLDQVLENLGLGIKGYVP